MQIRKLSPAAGMRWVADGFRLLRRQPMALLAISFLNLVLLSVAVLIPVIGSLAPLVLTPVLSVGVMHAVRAADRGERPTPGMLFAGFREDEGRAWKPLLALGLVNAIATVAALAFSALAGGDTLMRIATGQVGADDPALEDPSIAWGAALFLVAYLPVQLAMWYAPLFVAWSRAGVGKALFFSLAATLRNKWAFVVYALGWFAVALAASMLVRLLQGLLEGSPTLLSLLLSPLSLVVITAVYCSFWATWRDVVEE